MADPDLNDRFCEECGGRGIINMGNPGQTVWDTCPVCKGDERELWQSWQTKMANLRKEKKLLGVTPCVF